jgi:DNA-binding NtrC family response regulator
MGLLCERDRAHADRLSRLSLSNPFSMERRRLEIEALDGETVYQPRDANLTISQEGNRPAITIENLLLVEKATYLLDLMRSALIARQHPSDAEMVLYQDLIFFVLYYRYRTRFDHTVTGAVPRERMPGIVDWYDDFIGDLEGYLHLPGFDMDPPYTPNHVFSLIFQIRRAFYQIYAHIVGGAPSMDDLRAAAWDSIFTHDLKRYARTMYGRMKKITTLITGPSGTGKELVARAIGLSQYIEFDPKTQRFVEDASASFHPLNLSSLSPTLIESELFGHARGSFTGSTKDHTGWLETCSEAGTVFLDEVGETDQSIQVKLLRVLECRRFQRIGETQDREFQGKIIAATNRDLEEEMREGRFRQDFYYRLCSDRVETPSLALQLQQAPGELWNMLLFISHKEVGPDEAEGIAHEALDFIAKNLGMEYPWPGNFRELEQCVRNIMIRGEYRPQTSSKVEAGRDLSSAMAQASITAEELLDQYCALVQARTHNWSESARLLGLDRRTVQRRVQESQN